MELESVDKKWAGIRLVEVFNMIYLGQDEVPPEKQLGTISMYSTPGPCLYKVDEVDMKMPCIKFGDPIILTGGPIKYLYFKLKFNLFCGAYTALTEVEWEDLADERGFFSYEENIESDDCTGQICVHFGMFGNAVVANVEVTLLGNSGLTNVHGYVVARNSRLDLPTCANILFWIKSDNAIQVSDQMIPLSKSLVGVPLGSEFYIYILLVCDNQELETVISFVPNEQGFFQNEYCNNKLQVKVAWDPWQESITS